MYTYTFIYLFSEVYRNLLEMCENYGPEPIKLWFGYSLGIILTKPEDIQVIILI